MSSTQTAVAILAFLPFIHQTTGILVVPHEIEGNFDEFLHTLVKVLLELDKEWPGKMIYLNFDSIFGDFFLKFFEEEVSDYLS